MGLKLDAPTVMGLIRTPSSTWAFSASSASLLCRTCLPQSVLTKVVRPGGRVRNCSLQSTIGRGRTTIPVPEAPQTIKQNWMPFFICFLRRTFIFGGRERARRQQSHHSVSTIPKSFELRSPGGGGALEGATNCQRTVDNPVARTGCMPDMIAGDGDG